MPTENQSHTPGPWQAVPGSNGNYFIASVYDEPLAKVLRLLADNAGRDAETEANAAFIVRACNSHADRGELLRWFLEACESGELKSRDNDAASLRSFSRRMELARAALALAKGGES